MILVLLACSTSGDGDARPCDPVLQADGTTASGFEYCEDEGSELGAVNRTSAEACTGDPVATIPACHISDEGHCAEDTDCAAGQVCGLATEGPFCRCFDVCGSDSACEADQACVCALQEITRGSSAHVVAYLDECLPATCRTGADCASGECGAAPDQCGMGGLAIGLYCRTEEDECRTNSDCARPTPVCTYNLSVARWECFESATCE